MKSTVADRCWLLLAAVAIAAGCGAATAAAPARGTGGDRRRRQRPPGTMDHLELDPTAITGNRELPKVMVIVPWKKADLGDLTGRPANSLLNEVLEPGRSGGIPPGTALFRGPGGQTRDVVPVFITRQTAT